MSRDFTELTKSSPSDLLRNMSSKRPGVATTMFPLSGGGNRRVLSSLERHFWSQTRSRERQVHTFQNWYSENQKIGNKIFWDVFSFSFKLLRNKTFCQVASIDTEIWPPAAGWEASSDNKACQLICYPDGNPDQEWTHPCSLNLSTSSMGFFPPIKRHWLGQNRDTAQNKKIPQVLLPRSLLLIKSYLPKLRIILGEVRDHLVDLNCKLSCGCDYNGTNLRTS